MPQGPMEAMMCARPVVYNFQPLPFAVHLPRPTPQSLVHELRKLRQAQESGAGYNVEGSEYWREKNHPRLLVDEIERVMRGD
jgi:hypothetical protein